MQAPKHFFKNFSNALWLHQTKVYHRYIHCDNFTICFPYMILYLSLFWETYSRYNSTNVDCRHLLSAAGLMLTVALSPGTAGCLYLREAWRMSATARGPRFKVAANPGSYSALNWLWPAAPCGGGDHLGRGDFSLQDIRLSSLISVPLWRIGHPGYTYKSRLTWVSDSMPRQA